MSTTSNTSLAIMNKKSIAISCIALVFAAFFNLSPANAKFATSLTGTQVNISANSYYDPVVTELECGDGESYSFNYRQRVVINGVTTIVLTEFVYAAGTHTLYFERTCGGLNIYNATTCGCLTPDFTPAEPIMDILTGKAVEIETAPEEVSFTEEIKTMLPLKSGGFLWIRKNDNKLFN